MRRREVLSVLGAAAAWPLTARAQGQKIHKVGILNLGPTSSEVGLKRGLRELGYAEGRNIIFETRYANGRQERLGELAKELLTLGVDLIASSTTQAIEAIRNLNATIPIVMTATSDPIGSGLIDNLSRPGNTTGVTLLSSDVAGKRVELLKEVAPHVSRIAVLAYKNHPPTALMFKETQAAARVLQIEVQLLEVDAVDIEVAFEAARKSNAQAMVVQQSVAFVTHIPRIAALAGKYHLPSIHEIRAYPVAGGLMSYGTNIENLDFARPFLSTKFSKEPRRTIFRSNSRPGSSWSSISRLPKPLI